MCGGRPIKVCVPGDWTGQVSVVLNVHKGRPSKHVQIVMGTTQELVGPEENTPPSTMGVSGYVVVPKTIR